MTELSKIPFNKPFIIGKELYNIAETILRGRSSGDGHFTHECCAMLGSLIQSPHVKLVSSCTAALEVTALALGLGPGDEVILPSYTYVSTANAFLLRGVKLVFVDIRRDTLNIDEKLIAERVTDKTKAILAVHYGGVGCNMPAILETAQKCGAAVVEDAAQALGATYEGKPLGSFGSAGVFSFHETKNCTCGEGGALACNDSALFSRIETIRNRGTNRADFEKGAVDAYTWVDIGSSALSSELAAAFLHAQLERIEEINRSRVASFNYYYEGLAALEEKGYLRRPIIPNECSHNGHIFYILLENEETRAALIKHLDRRKIHAVFHYVPLHSSPKGRELGNVAEDLPVTEELSRRVLRLPMYYELTKEEQNRVIEGIETFFSFR